MSDIGFLGPGSPGVEKTKYDGKHLHIYVYMYKSTISIVCISL